MRACRHGLFGSAAVPAADAWRCCSRAAARVLPGLPAAGRGELPELGLARFTGRGTGWLGGGRALNIRQLTDVLLCNFHETCCARFQSQDLARAKRTTCTRRR
jgi:hypothetical protein